MIVGEVDTSSDEIEPFVTADTRRMAFVRLLGGGYDHRDLALISRARGS